MSYPDKATGAVGLVVIVIVILGLVGYAMNIYKLVFTCDFESPYKCEVIRGAGAAVPPVGAITGWLDLGK